MNSHPPIRKPVHFEILGYRYVPTYQKGDKGKYQMVVSEQSWKRLQMNLKSITRKTAPHSLTMRIARLKEVSQGWINPDSYRDFPYGKYYRQTARP